MSANGPASEFDQLEPGSRFTTRGRTVTESDIAAFSALTWDHHPIHTDAEWAARSEFGGRIAHGAMMLAFAIGLVPLDPERVLALRGFDRVSFKRPLRIGDTIRVESRLEEKRELDAASGLVTFTWRIVNQHGQAVSIIRPAVVWRRGAPVAAPVEDPVGEEVFL